MPRIRITARPAQGFYRAGLHHPAEPVIHDADDFTEEQRVALQAEPMLIVELLPDVEPPAVDPASIPDKQAKSKRSSSIADDSAADTATDQGAG